MLDIVIKLMIDIVVMGLPYGFIFVYNVGIKPFGKRGRLEGVGELHNALHFLGKSAQKAEKSFVPLEKDFGEL
jgi:hypothetical protein